jgi:hypothetical protein
MDWLSHGLQFYKNLSKGLQDIVWKVEDDMKESACSLKDSKFQFVSCKSNNPLLQKT